MNWQWWNILQLTGMHLKTIYFHKCKRLYSWKKILESVLKDDGIHRLIGQPVHGQPPTLCNITPAMCIGEIHRRKQNRKEAVGTFGMAEDHMVYGGLKLYWLDFNTTNGSVGFHL